MPTNNDAPVTSVIRLEDDEWVIANIDHPDVVTRGLWLSTVLSEHRRALEELGATSIRWRYLIGDTTTADRIARIREAGAQIAGLRHRANELESQLRPDREELMDVLAELHLAPTEIAHVAGVPPTALHRDLGSDEEVRLARWLLHHLQTRTGQGDDEEPV